MDETVEVVEAVTAIKPRDVQILVAGGVIGGMLIGSAVGYILAKKQLTTKYDQISKQEIEEAKRFYARLYKQDEFQTPEDAAKSLGAKPVTTRERNATDALREYQAISDVNDMEEDEETEVETTPVSTTRNIFTDNKPDQVWDLEEEIKNRTEDEPYIISQEEYADAERDYEQSTLSYFAEDDVLVDEQEKPIEDVDGVVGEGNLTRFGHGSNDNRLVYVRNDRLSMDFEIVKNEGSYTKEVLGFQHEDGGRRIEKFRGDYD